MAITLSMNEFLISVEKRAFRMAQIAVGNDDDAMDIVQDSMLSLVKGYSNKPSEQWRALFYRILYNRINDWYRSQKQQSRWRIWLDNLIKPDDSNEDPIALLADPRPDQPEQKLLESINVQRIEQAIKQLPQRQQQCFMLRCWEGFSTQETAKLMHCSEGSIKTHYSRALHNLRAQLKETSDD